MTHIEPTLPAAGDTNWATPLNSALESIVEQINLLDDSVSAALIGWQPNTAYGSGEYVLLPDGTIGQASASHISGSAFDSGYWIEVTGGTGSAGTQLVDNGDGTFTISGPGVADNGDGTFTISGSGISATLPTAASLAGSQDVYAPAPLGGASHDDANILTTINANPGKVVKLRAGAVYQIDSLRLPSNTYLDLNGSELRQVSPTGGSGGGACLRNANQSDTVGTDTNITVTNGKISVGTGASGRIVAFQGVRGLHFDRVTVQRRTDATFGDWMFYLRAIDDFSITNFRITGGTVVGEDGLHIKSSTRGVIDNGIIDAGDDALVFVHQFNVTRATSDIAVSNLVLSSAQAHLIRLSVYTGETFPISRIRLSNIVGNVPPTFNGVPNVFNDDTNTGLLRDISLDGINFDLANQTNSNAAFNLNNLQSSTFSDIRVKNAGGRIFNIDTCTNVSLEQVHGQQKAGAAVNSAYSLSACTSVSLNFCSVANSTQHAFSIANSTDVTINGCRATGSSGYSVWLTGAVRPKIIGSTLLGGTGGIACDTTAPPSGVSIIGSTVQPTSGSALGSPPADTRAVGNTGISDTSTSSGTQGLFDPFTGTDGTAPSSTIWAVSRNDRGGAAGSNLILTNKLRMITGPTIYSICHLEGVGMARQGGTDVVARFTPQSQIAAAFMIAVNSSNDLNSTNGGNTATGYYMEVDAATVAASGGISLYQNTTQLGSTVVKTITAGTDYLVRFRRWGLTLSARVWAASGAEPATWDITYELSTQTALPAYGVISIGTQTFTGAAATFDVDYVVAT